MFIVALFSIVKMWKQPKCPSTDDKEDVIHTDTRTHTHTRTHTRTLKYYSAMKKKEIRHLQQHG